MKTNPALRVLNFGLPEFLVFIAQLKDLASEVVSAKSNREDAHARPIMPCAHEKAFKETTHTKPVTQKRKRQNKIKLRVSHAIFRKCFLTRRRIFPVSLRSSKSFRSSIFRVSFPAEPLISMALMPTLAPSSGVVSSRSRSISQPGFGTTRLQEDAW